MSLLRCSICGILTADACPICYEPCRLVVCDTCFHVFHAHCFSPPFIYSGERRSCPNCDDDDDNEDSQLGTPPNWEDIAGSGSPSKLSRRKQLKYQESEDSSALNLTLRKKLKCQVSAGVSAPSPIPPPQALALPPICSICRYEIADICPECSAPLEANNQHVPVCHAVQCRICRYVFHYHCLIQMFRDHQGRRDCPTQFINHQFRFQRQRPGDNIWAYFLNI